MEFKTLTFFHYNIDVVDDNISTFDYAKHTVDYNEAQKKDHPFYIMDVGEIFRKHAEWREHLPRVRPYYAVKCNNNNMLLTVLARLGYGFDCASMEEIKEVMSLGVGANRIIYANPCKPTSYLVEATRREIKNMTFDNDVELAKIHASCPNAELVLRIATPDAGAAFNLSEKFGCDAEEEGPELLKKAKELGMKVIGISFHVGSGCRNADVYAHAIEESNRLFEIGRSFGHNMTLLDLGGGFPGSDSGDVTFEDIAIVVRKALAKYFPPEEEIEVIAEPGRFYATTPFGLAVNVIGRKQALANKNDILESAKNQRGYVYYINDGIYNSFNSILFEGPECVSEPKCLKHDGGAQYSSTIWGPTCCNMDCVVKKITLPRLEVGDWLFFKNMGAYTLTVSSEFNGYKRPKIYYIIRKKYSTYLQNMVQQDSWRQPA